MKNIPFPVLIDSVENGEKILSSLGVHSKGLKIMGEKSVFAAIKLKDLSPVQANIIKQEMLSLGADAATSKGAINHSAKKTDVLIMGTAGHYKKLITKIRENYFDLPSIADCLEKSINNYFSPANYFFAKEERVSLKETKIMGILNVTPDSFSDGGKYLSFESAIKKAEKMISEGARIIDIGGESTRPGSKGISEEEEIKRILPVVKELSGRKDCLISVDTRKSKVAKKALQAGASIINDVSGLNFDKNMAKVIADFGAGVVVMHMKGNPKNMQKNPEYKDLIFEVISGLQKSIEIASKAGILSNRIIVDPGFGFGKTLEHNYTLLKNLKSLRVLGYPIMVGTSRKAMIGKILNVPPEERIGGTVATSSIAVLNGADILRVHDVKEALQAAKIVDFILGGNI